MIWMRAVGILSHERSSFPDLRRRGVGKGVEEIVRLEQHALFLLCMLIWLIDGVRRNVSRCLLRRFDCW